MNNCSPKISVFVPYYNDKKYLKKCIDSILQNNFKEIELILLNHASTDGSKEIAHSYNDKRIVHLEMDKNYLAGGGILFKKALSIARGKYFKPFCADDMMPRDCLSQLYTFMEHNRESIGLCFSLVKHIDYNDDVVHIPKTVFYQTIDLFKIFMDGKNCLCYPASFFRMDVLRTMDIDNSLILLFDVSLWVKTIINGFEVAFVNTTYINYRIHNEQMSKKSLQNQKMLELEQKVFWKTFLEIKDISFIKKVWPNSKYIKLLKAPADIPFVIAREMLVSGNFSSHSYGYIYSQLNDEKTSDRLKEVFNYDTLQFRKDIICAISVKRSYRDNVYNTPPKFLQTKDLMFLLVRSIFVSAKRIIKRFI